MGGDVVHAATAEAAEARRGGAATLHGGVDAAAAVARHPRNVDNECSVVAMVLRPGGATQVVPCEGPPATSTRRRRRQGHGLGGECWQ